MRFRRPSDYFWIAYSLAPPGFLALFLANDGPSFNRSFQPWQFYALIVLGVICLSLSAWLTYLGFRMRSGYLKFPPVDSTPPNSAPADEPEPEDPPPPSKPVPDPDQS